MPIFPSKYIRAAILISFWAGINMGSHVAFSLGFNYSLGNGFHAYIQTHGYLQLMGWAGLFIMGVSIHFLSRLAHLEHVNKLNIDIIYFLMVLGLVIRFIAHSILPYLENTIWFSITSWSVLLSSILVMQGIALYLWFLFSVIRKLKPTMGKQNRDIRFFLVLNVLGWTFFGLGSTALTLFMVNNQEVSMLHNWHLFTVDIFIHFTIFSICAAVGLRALPLFLRLPAIKWNVKRFSIFYLIAILVFFGLKIFYHYIYIASLPKIISIISILKNALLIWFIYKLDVLFQTRPPWTAEQKETRVPHRKEPREYLPDYGEFGRFEWLIRSAFIWLFIGLVFDIISQLGLLFWIQTGISTDGIRHMWLAGFTSLLIMGMAVRMIPGMTGAMKLQHPNRVAILAIVVNMAVLFRALTLVLPESWLNIIPNGSIITTQLFGLSGILFMIGLWIFYTIMKPVLKEAPID